MSRPDWVPAHAECVEGVWVYQWPGDVDVLFEQPGGVEGQIDEHGITLDVEADERGGGWDGDCPHNRTLPLAALRRALEMYDAAVLGRWPGGDL